MFQILDAIGTCFFVAEPRKRTVFEGNSDVHSGEIWTLTWVAPHHQWWRILLRGRRHCRWGGRRGRWTLLYRGRWTAGFWLVGGLFRQQAGVCRFSWAAARNGTAGTWAVLWTEEDVNRALRALQGHLKPLKRMWTDRWEGRKESTNASRSWGALVLAPCSVLTLASASQVELWSPLAADRGNQTIFSSLGSGHTPTWWTQPLRNTVQEM